MKSPALDARDRDRFDDWRIGGKQGGLQRHSGEHDPEIAADDQAENGDYRRRRGPGEDMTRVASATHKRTGSHGDKNAKHHLGREDRTDLHCAEVQAMQPYGQIRHENAVERHRCGIGERAAKLKLRRSGRRFCGNIHGITNGDESLRRLSPPFAMKTGLHVLCENKVYRS
ncbi:hypothetical protein D3C80_774010 [compost metagenome]